MNQQLTREYTKEEIGRALKQMAPMKSPNSDGFRAYFYHKYWETVGRDVYNAVLDILHSDDSFSFINSTFIALISKKDNSKRVSDFRPINLCNFLYNLVSKVICNKLKLIMPLLVSKSQSAFILGRLITNNIIVAYELLHSMKSNKNKNGGSMVIKFDMCKAYDR